MCRIFVQFFYADGFNDFCRELSYVKVPFWGMVHSDIFLMPIEKTIYLDRMVTKMDIIYG